MEAFLIIAIFAGSIILIRLFGAWMLRINDVISLQKEILAELKEMNKKG